MPGVRITPNAERLDHALPNAMIVVRDLNRPFPAPKDGRRLEDVQPVCDVCKVQHLHKAYHLQLDGEKTTIVSETIWGKLQGMIDNGGFVFVNYVEDPPAQNIGITMV